VTIDNNYLKQMMFKNIGICWCQ